MLSQQEAIKKLKQYWETDKFVFQADFHIPKNVTLREGSKPFGYFRNIRLNGEIIEYPLETSVTNEKRISIFQVLKEGLEDGKQYEIELELSKDEYRKKNPYALIVQRFKAIENHSEFVDIALVKTINDIFQENININSPFQVVNLANSVESLATDIYSEDKRFIYELIQNADDAALDDDSEISIDILDNYVVISHNGAPFNSRDIRGLCSVGLGTKTNDATKTGYKGIGFKSVFGQPEGIVYVKSENTLFRFDREFAKLKGWNSKWGNKSVWEEKNGVIFNCPWQMMPILSQTVGDTEVDFILNDEKFSVKTAIKIGDSKTLHKNINDFFGDAKFLLFLRRISKVVLKFNSLNVELGKKRNSENGNIVVLQSNNQNISNWYVKNWIHNIPLEIQKELKADPKTPKKIQSMEKTEISYAIKINQALNEIQLLDPGDSALYSYLPTTVKEYNIPFIVNCNFLLDASREKIHKNRKWNEWLFQVIGYKTVECCSEFVVNNFFEKTYLSLFRNGIINESDNLCKKINEGLKIGLDKFSILKNRNGDLCRLKEIGLDPFNLFETDTELPHIVASFLSERHQGNTIKGVNLISLTEQNKVLKKLEVNELNENQLQDFFSSEQLASFITIFNNVTILNFLKPLDLNDPSGKWYTAITNNKLIINQDNKLDFIKRVCFPIDYETDYEFENTLINSEVFKSIEENIELLEWLKKLGVTDPGSIAFLEKEIIGIIDTCVSVENYLDITKFILKLHNDKKLTETHYLHLQELPLSTNKGLIKANQTVLSAVYNPTIDFSKVLPSLPYISDNYLNISTSQEFRIFFKLLNVTDDIEFIKTSKKLSSELPADYVKSSNNFAREGHAYPHLIGVFHPNLPSLMVSFYLQSFSFLDHTNKLDFAQLFWERLFGKYHFTIDSSGISPYNYAPGKNYTIYNLGGGLEISSLDEMNWGRMPGNLVKIPGFALWYFDNVSCVPTTVGLQLAKETFTNSEYNIELAGNYLPIIKINSIVPEDWRRILNLKNKFSLNDLLLILEKISSSINNHGSIDKENEKRLGLVYNELISRLDLDFENTIQTLKNWAANHPLISTSKKNIASKNLLYVNILGFENSLNGIETILIPKNVDTKSTLFEEFLKALEIKVIDNFNYQAREQEEFYDLKIKLLKLIGPICLMLKNKMIINDLDKALYERFLKVSNTDFISCKNIKPVFMHSLEEIEGKTVLYYYDDINNKFLISESWKNPSTVLNISYQLSKLLIATRLEKEIMMMLNMYDHQIVDYLASLEVNYLEYKFSKIFKDISSYTQELENKSFVKITEGHGNNFDQNAPPSGSSQSPNEENTLSDFNETEDKIPQEDKFLNEVEEFISNELEGTEWSKHITELRMILQLDNKLGEQKKRIYNLLAKIKLAKKINIKFEPNDQIDNQFNLLMGDGENYFVHSARGSFAYISPIEILRMKKEGYKMALDFGNKMEIKIYEKAEDILSLNINHLLLYQNYKPMEELFEFCENNQNANKRLLIVDKANASNKSKELLKLMIPDEEY